MALFSEAAVFESAGSLFFRYCRRCSSPDKKECHIIARKRVECSDGDNGVPLGVRKSPFILAFDIDNAGTGRGFYFGRPEFLVVNVRRGCQNAPGEAGIDHKAGCKRYVGFVMPEPFPFLANIPRVQGKKPAERLAADRAVARPGLKGYVR